MLEDIVNLKVLFSSLFYSILGVVVFADEVRAMVKRSSSTGTWRQIVGALSTHPLEATNRGRTTDLPRAVNQAMGRITNRCIFAIVSDFFSDIEHIKDALARLRHPSVEMGARALLAG